jgi:hypothetical protein
VRKKELLINYLTNEWLGFSKSRRTAVQQARRRTVDIGTPAIAPIHSLCSRLSLQAAQQRSFFICIAAASVF